MATALKTIQFEESFENPLSREVVASLSQSRISRVIAALSLDVFAVGAAIYLAESFRGSLWFPVVYLSAVMWIGGRQHSLMIQMHDAAHGRISKNKFWNDFIGEVLCAWPMFFRMLAYRQNHMLHHRYSNTDKDPDFRPGRFPKTQKEILKHLLRDISLLNMHEAFEELRKFQIKSSFSMKIARLSFYLILAALLTALGAWKIYLLYWIIPLFTWVKVSLRLRAIADHDGVEDREHPFNTRTIVPNLFDRMFLAPRNCSYHLGHHLYATVPWYNLKRLHRELMKNPEFASRSQITQGFIGLWREFPWDKT